MEAEHECLRKTREDLCNRELTISFQEGSLASCTTALALRARELANKEKRLAKKELHELPATRRKVEELQAVRGSRRRRSRISGPKVKPRWCPSASALFTRGTRYRGEHHAPHAGFCRSQDAKARGSHR
jgi:hypothetical protein